MLRALLLAICLCCGALPARAAELLYVSEPGCPYCREWDAVIGPVYAKTAEGQRAPLRRLDKRSAELGTVSLARPIRYTPTFVLLDGNAELGRIEGYPGEDFFWGRLARLLDDHNDTGAGR